MLDGFLQIGFIDIRADEVDAQVRTRDRGVGRGRERTASVRMGIAAHVFGCGCLVRYK